LRPSPKFFTLSKPAPTATIMKTRSLKSSVVLSVKTPL